MGPEMPLFIHSYNKQVSGTFWVLNIRLRSISVGLLKDLNFIQIAVFFFFSLVPDQLNPAPSLSLNVRGIFFLQGAASLKDKVSLPGAFVTTACLIYNSKMNSEENQSR